MKSSDLARAVFFVILCEVVGIAGAIFTTPAIPGWYAQLVKPPFAPPNWIFGPVWTILYALMGIALSIIWGLKKSQMKKLAITYFGIQLVLNFFWSYIFFGMRQPLLAFVELTALWFFIILTTKKFYTLSKPAGYMMVPYIAWVTFAGLLNLSIALLN